MTDIEALYQDDLAYVHHVGFRDVVDGAAPFLIEQLRSALPAGGRVLDIGCGGGLFLKALAEAGFHGIGVDPSPAMIAFASDEAPDADLICGSAYDVELPDMDAVTALGEGLGYLDPGGDQTPPLERLIGEIGAKLPTGGLFMFDLIVSDSSQNPSGRGGRVGEDWAVFADNGREPESDRLTRSITTFRKIGELYRRTDEVHVAHMFRSSFVTETLDAAGFDVETGDRYGAFRLGPARMAFIARKR